MPGLWRLYSNMQIWDSGKEAGNLPDTVRGNKAKELHDHYLLNNLFPSFLKSFSLNLILNWLTLIIIKVVNGIYMHKRSFFE